MTKRANTATPGIKPAARGEAELYRWFLACLLFGKPIQQAIAEQAYHKILGAKIGSIEQLANTSWDQLVALLDSAHYVRYDYSTATKLLTVAQEVIGMYGSMKEMVVGAKSSSELRKRLLGLHGVGRVTAGIFMNGIAKAAA